MTAVTLAEAGIGLNFPCARCQERFDTALQADNHMAKIHDLHWHN